jgi:hypothetical protein
VQLRYGVVETPVSIRCLGQKPILIFGKFTERLDENRDFAFSPDLFPNACNLSVHNQGGFHHTPSGVDFLGECGVEDRTPIPITQKIFIEGRKEINRLRCLTWCSRLIFPSPQISLFTEYRLREQVAPQ